MKLVKSVHDAIWDEYKSYKEVKLYIEKWHIEEWDYNGNHDENFVIALKESKDIDLLQTLHNMSGSVLLKVAIDMGVDTPDFIPTIPIFKNALKSNYITAYDTFTKAFKLIDSDPGLAIGLVNSALESIIKEIMTDDRISSKVTGTETLYKLAILIIKEFNLSNESNPKEIKTISSSLLSICQMIEKLRSEKTDFHGKTIDDYLIKDSIYTYFVVNAVTTVGLFLNTYYKTKYPTIIQNLSTCDDLPF